VCCQGIWPLPILPNNLFKRDVVKRLFPSEEKNDGRETELHYWVHILSLHGIPAHSIIVVLLLLSLIWSSSTIEVVATAKNSGERLQFELVTWTLASNCYTHFPPLRTPRRSDPIFSSRGRISQAIGNAVSHIRPQKGSYLGAASHPRVRSMPIRRPTKASRSGIKALIMHLQCMYTRQCSRLACHEIQDRCTGLMPRESKLLFKVR
jgi:hypothetical protein